MHLVSKINFSKQNYFSLCLALIPLSFIAGNMILNINIILFILSSILIFNKDLFNIKLFAFDKLLILFFLFIILTGITNDILVLNKLSWGTKYATTVRSIFFLKYLLLYFVIRYLIEHKSINLKLFFISCTFASIFVCFDIFYQFTFGQDIFGYKIIPEFRKLSGPFGNELIAGGYIQRFCIFSFFLLPMYLSKKQQFKIKFLIPILFLIFFIAIILSGNRMPLLLFLLSIILILYFQKETRKYFLSFIIIFPILFLIIFNSNVKVKSNFKNFYNQISNIIVIVLSADYNQKNSPQYLNEFKSFYETWKLNKYSGGGIKSFRYYCHVRDNIDKNSKFICNMHPHNYYLEILTETGLIGFTMISVLFIYILYLGFYKKYFSHSKSKEDYLITPFLFLFFIEIFPIKSTGSFFTTGNASYIFLILAILVGLIRKGENSIENKF